MAPESRTYGAKMALLTEDRYVLCPVWRQLVQVWAHELVALNRETPVLLKSFPQLEAIWIKVEPDASITGLVKLIDSLALRDPACHLIVCLDEATPAEMQEILEHGADEILFQAGIMAEPLILQKTRIALKARRENVEALKTQIVRHQKALQNKTEFLAWLSHEIRTPMNGVLGLLELFPKPNLSAEQTEMLEVMDRSGRRVVDLLSEILDISRIEAGKMSRVTRDFQLRRLIEDSLRLYARDARTRGLLVGSSIDADVPDALRGDERKLSQILNNLISNAVKYTREGEVQVKVSVEAWDGGGCRLLLEVQDTGHGIDAAELDKLFAPYEQTHSAHLSPSPSSGLGLSLTKNLVELLGGSIRVQSHPGEGSTFSCTLPFALPDEAVKSEAEEREDRAYSSNQEAKRAPWNHPGSGRAYVLRRSHTRVRATAQGLPEALTFEGAHILVVDDDPVNLKVADKQLKKLKAATTLAESGVDALDWLEKRHFDLIFVDCHMPHMDGFELVRILRSLPQVIPGTPVIALTALGRDEDREKALRHGFSDFLAKPAQLEEIQRLLGRWLSRESMPPF